MVANGFQIEVATAGSPASQYIPPMPLALRPQISDRMRGMSEPDAYELAVQITATLARGIGSVSRTVGDRHPAYRCAGRFKARLKVLADRAESHPVGATDLLDIVAATANEIWAHSRVSVRPIYAGAATAVSATHLQSPRPRCFSQRQLRPRRQQGHRECGSYRSR